MARGRRKPFTAAGPFVVRRAVLFDGQKLVPHEPFPHEGVAARRLRQLYDNRVIDVGAAPVTPAEPLDVVTPATPTDPLSGMDDEQIIAAARALTGVNYRSVDRARRALCDN